MAKLFGKIEEEELDDLPDSLKNVIKAASEAQEGQLSTINTKLAELDGKVNPQETPEQKAERERREEAERNNKTGLSSTELMLLETRKDTILMRLERDPDKTVATAIKLFRGEIETNLAKSTPQLKGDEAYIRNLVKLAIGTHFNEIVADINKQEGKYNEFFVESASGGNGQRATPTDDPVKNMTAEEKKAADAMGMSYEEFAKQLADVREGRY